MAHVVNLSC